MNHPEDFLYSWWDSSDNSHHQFGENNGGMHPNDAMFWYGIAAMIFSGFAAGVYVPLAPKLHMNPRN
jgi:hypothetical protein